MSDAPTPGSPEEMIETGYVTIMRGLFRLREAGDYEEAQKQVAVLVNLFLQDKMELMKKTGKII
jgi:hypothetical protein